MNQYGCRDKSAFLSFFIFHCFSLAQNLLSTKKVADLSCLRHVRDIIIIIIIHEFHRDASLETKLHGRYVSRITLQL